MLWLLVLILILDSGNNGCINCDSIIWILLLSRFCCGDNGPPPNPCGCGCNR